MLSSFFSDKAKKEKKEQQQKRNDKTRELKNHNQRWMMNFREIFTQEYGLICMCSFKVPTVQVYQPYRVNCDIYLQI